MMWRQASLGESAALAELGQDWSEMPVTDLVGTELEYSTLPATPVLPARRTSAVCFVARCTPVGRYTFTTTELWPIMIVGNCVHSVSHKLPQLTTITTPKRKIPATKIKMQSSLILYLNNTLACTCQPGHSGARRAGRCGREESGGEATVMKGLA